MMTKRLRIFPPWFDRIKASQVLLCLVVFGMNLARMAPTITPGDSAELSAAQFTMGIAHSPGYPLFVVSGRLFSSLAPFGNPSYRTNLFSVVCSAVCALLLFNLAHYWSASVLLSFFASLFILSVPAVREQFLTTEVFALNSLILLALLGLASKTLKGRPSPVDNHLSRGDWGAVPVKRNCLIALLMGLGMGNQHTIVLVFPSLVLVYLITVWSDPDLRAENLKSMPLLAFFFTLGLSLYVFLPVRSFQDPLLDWEDPETFGRFWDVFSRSRYGMFQLAQGATSDLSPARFFDRTIFFIREIYNQFTLLPALLLLAGCVMAFLRKGYRKVAAVLALFMVLSGPFFLTLSNVTTGPGGHGIIMRFLPMPFIAFGILGVIGFAHLGLGLMVGLLLFFSYFQLPQSASMRDNYLLHDYEKNVLRTVPRNAILFADRADEVEFATAYVLYAVGKRQDIRFVDCNAGVTRSIYGDDYYGIWGEPRLAIRTKTEGQIIRETDRPVFYATVEPDMIPIKRKAEGMLFIAADTDPEPFSWDRIYSLRYDARSPGFREIPLLCSYGKVMGKYMLERREFKGAGRFFRICSLLEPTGAWNHTIALWFFEKGAYRDAEEFFHKSLARGPEPDKVLCNLGILYERQGKTGEAEETYRKALEVNSRSFQAHYNLGVMYWKEQRWSQVVEEFGRVLEIKPDHGEAAKFLHLARQRIRSRT